MYTRLIGLLLLILSLLLSGLPLAAQEVALLQKAEVMIVRPGEAAPAFACAEEDCERLAWLPAGARVCGHRSGRRPRTRRQPAMVRGAAGLPLLRLRAHGN